MSNRTTFVLNFYLKKFTKEEVVEKIRNNIPFGELLKNNENYFSLNAVFEWGSYQIEDFLDLIEDFVSPNYEFLGHYIKEGEKKPTLIYFIDNEIICHNLNYDHMD